MDEHAIGALIQRVDSLERKIWWHQILAGTTLLVLLVVSCRDITRSASPLIAEEIRARRFVVVNSNNKDSIEMYASADLMPSLVLNDANGLPRTHLDLLSDGSPRLYFADANRRIRLRLGAASDGHSNIEVNDINGETIWGVPTPKN